MQNRLGAAIQLVLAIAIFYLGYTLYAFTNTINKVVDTYPQMMAEINTTADKLEIEQWLLLAKTFEELSPQALDLADDIKATIDGVNKTVASVDNKIPMLLDEVKVIRSETIPLLVHTVETVNSTTLPVALDELKQYRTDVIPALMVESKGYRETTIPSVITESEQLRNDVPAILAKTDEIVEKSEQLTQQATQGAVKGVLLSPVNLIRDAGTGLISLPATREPEKE
ncbi:hypothetical protein RJ45_20510 [Photobacterium gaetbulicola]|uniref:Uncharacterized protein n=1 Tax=Photobacterium gaetbulicola TaxID=1295392 RepID=A0A0B9FZZ9_9GAMM|nr:hypothetical protein [Photobacterium gaetbulicola]KHT61914.1 hypothetical protein RJ45_20510 [Photobacterium gaetbulicola]